MMSVATRYGCFCSDPDAARTAAARLIPLPARNSPLRGSNSRAGGRFIRLQRLALGHSLYAVHTHNNH